MSGRGYEPRKIVYYEDEEVQVLIRERDTWRDQCEDLTGQLEQLTRHNGMMSDSLNEVGLERDNVKQENETLKKEKETMKLENEKLNRELARTRENVETSQASQAAAEAALAVSQKALARQTVSDTNLVRDVDPTVAGTSGSEDDGNGKRKPTDQGRKERPKRTSRW